MLLEKYGRYSYSDLTGASKMKLAKPRPEATPRIVVKREWICYEKDEIRRTLNMYRGEFLVSGSCGHGSRRIA